MAGNVSIPSVNYALLSSANFVLDFTLSKLVRHFIDCLLRQGQGGMRQQLDPSAHTMKSHGSALARKHVRDWLILLLLIVIEIVLFVIHPFKRFVGRDMMEDLRYPMKENTVPVWAVPVSVVILFFTA